MKIEISRDEAGAQLAVVVAVSVGLGRAGSQGSAFLGRGLVAGCKARAAEHPLPRWACLPRDTAVLCPAELSSGPQT